MDGCRVAKAADTRSDSWSGKHQQPNRCSGLNKCVTQPGLMVDADVLQGAMDKALNFAARMIAPDAHSRARRNSSRGR